MQYGDRYLCGLVPHELAYAILERRPRIVHLVDEEDALPGQLFLGFLDPLHHARKLAGLVVGVVIRHADSEDGLAKEGAHDPRRDEAPRAYGDDDVGLEARSLDSEGDVQRGLVDVLVREVVLLHGRILVIMAGINKEG